MAAAWARIPRPTFDREVPLGLRLMRKLRVGGRPDRPPFGARTAVRKLTQATTVRQQERAAWSAVLWAAYAGDNQRTHLKGHAQRRYEGWLSADGYSRLKSKAPFIVTRFLRAAAPRIDASVHDRPLRRSELPQSVALDRSEVSTKWY
jgi:hypothetical protein